MYDRPMDGAHDEPGGENREETAVAVRWGVGGGPLMRHFSVHGGSKSVPESAKTTKPHSGTS